MFQVAIALSFFIKLALEPANSVREQCACFKYMCVVLNILKIGDAAVEHLDNLERAISLQHDLFLKYYESMAKPKKHYLWHIPECIRRWQANLTCFSPDRKHKAITKIAAHTYDHVEKHVHCSLNEFAGSSTNLMKKDKAMVTWNISLAKPCKSPLALSAIEIGCKISPCGKTNTCNRGEGINETIPVMMVIVM